MVFFLRLFRGAHRSRPRRVYVLLLPHAQFFCFVSTPLVSNLMAYIVGGLGNLRGTGGAFVIPISATVVGRGAVPWLSVPDLYASPLSRRSSRSCMRLDPTWRRVSRGSPCSHRPELLPLSLVIPGFLPPGDALRRSPLPCARADRSSCAFRLPPRVSSLFSCYRCRATRYA